MSPGTSPDPRTLRTFAEDLRAARPPLEDAIVDVVRELYGITGAPREWWGLRLNGDPQMDVARLLWLLATMTLREIAEELALSPGATAVRNATRVGCIGPAGLDEDEAVELVEAKMHRRLL